MKSIIAGSSAVLLGLLIAVISGGIVLGSFILAFTEGGLSLPLGPSPTPETISLLTSLPPLPTPSPTETVPPPLPTLTATSLPSETPTQTQTDTPAPGACDFPEGWVPYSVQKNDTLRKLSESHGLSQQDLADANCLEESLLAPGQVLYLPPVPATVTPVPCGPPANWLPYKVQPSDNLFNISQRVGVSVFELKSKNCLTSDIIKIGQILYVPKLPPPIAPSPTSPPPPTLTPPPTSPPSPIPTDGNISRETDQP